MESDRSSIMTDSEFNAYIESRLQEILPENHFVRFLASILESEDSPVEPGIAEEYMKLVSQFALIEAAVKGLVPLTIVKGEFQPVDPPDGWPDKFEARRAQFQEWLEASE
jgi:hypothetical protein